MKEDQMMGWMQRGSAAATWRTNRTLYRVFQNHAAAIFVNILKRVVQYWDFQRWPIPCKLRWEVNPLEDDSLCWWLRIETSCWSTMDFPFSFIWWDLHTKECSSGWNNNTWGSEWPVGKLSNEYKFSWSWLEDSFCYGAQIFGSHSILGYI